MASKRRDIIETVRDFNAAIAAVLKIADMLLTDNDSKTAIESVKRKLSILKNIGPSEPLSQAASVFLQFSDKIMKRDEEFFINANVREQANAVGKPIDKNSEYVEGFVDKMRDAYQACDQDDKDVLYGHVRMMLRCSIEWKFYMESSDL